MRSAGLPPSSFGSYASLTSEARGRSSTLGKHRLRGSGYHRDAIFGVVIPEAAA